MPQNNKTKLSKWFWTIVLAPFALLALAVLTVCLFAEIPSLEELEHPDSKQATQIISDDGVVLSTFHIENRTFISYEEISPNVINAALATEDIRFYKHSGIDFKGLARVLVKTLALHRSSQGGGSTITQQLAKTLYPRPDTSRKLVMVWVKIKEWITAVKIERNFTKDEIMRLYLNSIFFGSSAYGIQTASQTFFSKMPSALTIEEAATLIGMVNKPTRYNPSLNPEQSLKRRNFVIAQMAKYDFITKAERDSICQIPIKLNYKVMDHNTGSAPYFRDMLRRDMNASKPRRSRYRTREDYSADSLRWENDDLYGWLNKHKKPDGQKYNLDKDGLKIYTTINSRMQRYAEEAVAEHLGKELQGYFRKDLKSKTHAPFSNDVPAERRERLIRAARTRSDRWRIEKEAGLKEEEILASFKEPRKMRVFAWNSKGYADTTMSPDDSIIYYKSILRAAMMAMEPETGYVRAYVGGPNYRYFKYDNVSQGRRQIGSTVKPFLYSLAMTHGFSPCDQVANVPQTFTLPGGREWTPRGGSGGILTLKMALTKSNNNVSAFLIKTFGPAAVVELMHNMGITGHIDEVYPLCVGSADVSVKDMVAAYNTFPSGGVYVEPLFVKRIEDSNGNTLTEFTNQRREVLGAMETREVIDMMESVINSGTGYRLRGRFGLSGEIAGKTGTTNSNSDGWFVGYTPGITAGVWAGGEDREIHFQSTSLGQGASMALPIWGRFYKKILEDGTLGISSSDTFVSPQDVGYDPGCPDGGTYLGGTVEDDEYDPGFDEDGNSEYNSEDYYFN
ncbi:MAG: transglycosylase domain-containing protein [Bacteroidales bacterium]|nr:transglycosylase domain-containing protein [Bacteroidales bacterium]